MLVKAQGAERGFSEMNPVALLFKVCGEEKQADREMRVSPGVFGGFDGWLFSVSAWIKAKPRLFGPLAGSSPCTSA